VTQHGSFPDRPRGRRARHSDEVPQDEREFPDLPPIRERRLSESDNRGMPGAAAEGGTVPRPVPRPTTVVQRPRRRDRSAPGEWGTPRGRTRLRRSTGSQPVPGPRGQRSAAAAGLRPGARPPGPAGPGSAAVRRLAGPASRSAALPAFPARPAAPAERPADALDTEISDDPMEAFSQRWHRRGADVPPDMRVASASTSSPAAWPWSPSRRSLRLVVNFTSGKSGRVGFGSLVTTFLPVRSRRCRTPARRFPRRR